MILKSEANASLFVLLFLCASDIIFFGINVIVPKEVVIMLLMITRTAPARYRGTL